MRVLDPNDPAEVLEAAAEVIEIEGWCQHRLRSADGSVCLMGAISRVAEDTLNRPGAWWGSLPGGGAAVQMLLARLGGEPKDFNDADTTTKQDVIDLLKSTAKDIRNGEVG